MVTKRNDKRYTATLAIGRNPDGSLKRKYFYGKTKKEVDLKIAKAKLDLENGMFTPDDGVTFIDIAHKWVDVAHPDIMPHTRKTYHTMIDKHLKSLHHIELKKLKPLHLQAVLKEMYDNGLSDNMMRDAKIIASAVLNFAMDNDLLFRNVFARVSVPKRGKAERLPITEEQKNLILRTWRGHRMGVAVLVMLYCGLRRGEIVALTWNDVDFEAMTISVTKAATFGQNQAKIKQPKTEAGKRIVPFPVQLLPIFKEEKRNSSIYVCPAADGSMMTNTAWTTSWNSYMHYLNNQAGGRDASRSHPKVVAMDRFTAHQLRHTYATMLYDAGVDVKTAQDFLGHADPTVTMNIYTHLSSQKKEKAILALQQHFADTIPEAL